MNMFRSEQLRLVIPLLTPVNAWLQDGSSLVDTMDRGLNDTQGGSEATPAALAVLHYLLHEQTEVRLHAAEPQKVRLCW